MPDQIWDAGFLWIKDDIDADGVDNLLNSFTYAYPVPNSLEKKWSEENTDILILENTLHTK